MYQYINVRRIGIRTDEVVSSDGDEQCKMRRGGPKWSREFEILHTRSKDNC